MVTSLPPLNDLPRDKGLAQVTQQRWCLEQVERPYQGCLVSAGAMEAPALLVPPRIDQRPTYQERERRLVEAVAIVCHIAVLHTGAPQRCDGATGCPS